MSPARVCLFSGKMPTALGRSVTRKQKEIVNCKYHIIHSPRGSLGKIYNNGWRTCCQTAYGAVYKLVLKEWEMMFTMIHYVSALLRETTTPGTSLYEQCVGSLMSQRECTVLSWKELIKEIQQGFYAIQAEKQWMEMKQLAKQGQTQLNVLTWTFRRFRPCLSPASSF